MPVTVMARALPYLIPALAAHWWLWPYTGSDVYEFLLPWFAHIRTTGPIAAFAAPFGDYAPPYLYLLAATTLLADWIDAVDLIKGLSVAGTIALTAATWHLLRTIAPARRGSAALVLLLPSTLLNAALMGQCDAMWAAACVMALAAAARRHHAAMLAWCGIALGFKLQAAFFFPFILALVIAGRVPLRLWPIAPLAWLATLAPAWCAGWPAADLLTIYLRQADTYDELARNAPNLWAIADALSASAHLRLTGVAFAAAAAGSIGCVVWTATRQLVGRRLLEAALLAPLIVAGLLPRMHERYFFLADIIALAIAIAWPDRRSVAVAVLVQAGSTLALSAYISGVGGLAVLGAAAMIAATYILVRALVRTPVSTDADRPALNGPPPRLLRQ